jgi:hypothetical protein
MQRLDLSGVNLNNVGKNKKDSRDGSPNAGGEIKLGNVKMSPKGKTGDESNKTSEPVLGGGKFDMSKLSKFINMEGIDMNKLGAGGAGQVKNAKSSLASQKRPENAAMFSELLDDVTYIPDPSEGKSNEKPKNQPLKIGSYLKPDAAQPSVGS